MSNAGTARSRKVVIGIGNDLRGDDGAGLAVVRTLRPLGQDQGIEVESGGETASLIDAWDGASVACVADATVAGLPAGTVTVVEVAGPLAAGSGAASYTHGLGLADAIGLGAALGRLPGRLVVVGIEGDSFELGAGLSPAVAAAIPAAARSVRRCLSADRQGGFVGWGPSSFDATGLRPYRLPPPAERMTPGDRPAGGAAPRRRGDR